MARILSPRVLGRARPFPCFGAKKTPRQRILCSNTHLKSGPFILDPMVAGIFMFSASYPLLFLCSFFFAFNPSATRTRPDSSLSFLAAGSTRS
jgi:hypothetical protein